jgi:hypothetical protein
MHPYPVLQRLCHFLESVVLHTLIHDANAARWFSQASGRRYLLP